MYSQNDSRSARRIGAHAEAIAAVRSRKPHLIVTVAIGALLGTLLTVSAVTPAAASEERVPVSTRTDGPIAMLVGEDVVTVTAADLLPTVRASLADAQAAIADGAAATGEVAAAGLPLDSGSTAVDTSALSALVTELSTPTRPSTLRLAEGDAALTAQIGEVTAATATLRSSLTAAQEKKRAEEQAAAEALANANTVEGAKTVARDMAESKYGWGSDQFACLSKLWQKESGWNYKAHNASSGATGIPQALPGSKMASAGSDWKTNAATQISWGLSYIDGRYGSPCSAWSHSQSVNWY